MEKSASLRNSTVFAIAILLAGAYFNYTFTNVRDMGQAEAVMPWILWSAMYLPAVVLPWRVGWRANDVGLGMGRSAAVVSALFLALLQVK